MEAVTIQTCAPYVEQKKENNKAIKRKIKFNFYLFSIGFAFISASYFALLSLQSSLNIEGSTGTISITVSLITCVVVGLVGAPNIIRVLGVHTTLIFGEFMMLIYIVGNLYPELYVLMPCSIALGIFYALVYPALSSISSQFALAYSKFGSLGDENYIANYQSQFYAIYLASQIFGNLISYAVMYGSQSDSTSDSLHFDNATEALVDYYQSTTQSGLSENSFFYCGSNDCQDPEIIAASMDKYKPPNSNSITLLIFVLVGSCIIGMFINIFIIPGCGRFGRHMDRLKQASEVENIEFECNFQPENEEFQGIPNEGYEEGDTDDSDDMSEGKYDEYMDENNNIDEPNQDGLNDTDQNNNNDQEYCPEMIIPTNTTYSSALEAEVKIIQTLRSDHKDPEPPEVAEYNRNDSTAEMIANDGPKEKSAWSTLKSTFSTVFSCKQFLLTGIILHYGMMRSFVFSDLTRAYASCVIGVQVVGIGSAINAVPSMILSFFGGQLAKKFGQSVLMLAAAVVNLGVYAFCLFWNPNPSQAWTIYIAFFLFGVCEGIWLPGTIVMMIAHYKRKQDIAMSVWNILFISGSAIMFGISSLICVNQKLYILIPLLIVAMITYGIAEYIDREKPEQESCEKRNEETGEVHENEENPAYIL